MHTTSLEVSKKLKEAGWKKEVEYGYRDDGELESRFIGYDYPAPTLGELIRHPLLLGYNYHFDTDHNGKLFFWAEPPDANDIEDLYKAEEPEDALGLALIDELKKASFAKYNALLYDRGIKK